MRFAGEDITGLPPREIARKGISRSFQIMNLFDDYSALDNVLIATPHVRRQGFNPWRDLGADSAAQDMAAAVLARSGWRARSACRPGACPTANGARWRSAWRWRPSRACCSSTSRPPAWAPKARRGWPNWWRSCKRALTIVIIEHDMKFLFGLADQISVIHWGQVIAQGTPDELRQNEWVARSNLGALA